MVRAPHDTVLLVDDDPAVGDSLKVLLELHGFMVVDFQSVDALLDHYPIPARTCLVVDVEIPVIGGVKLLARLADAGKRVPTVLVTGHMDDRVRRQATKVGAFAVIEKPFDSVLMLDTVRRALDGASKDASGMDKGGAFSAAPAR